MTAPQTLTSAPLVGRLLTATRPEEVEGLLADARAEGINGERDLGDRDNNAGTVQFASNPYSALVERVTNAIDAMLELEAARHDFTDIDANPDAPNSPREAATAWYRVPKTGLNDLTTDERRALAQNIRVTLAESGIKQRPTVVIEDRGIGQSPADFPQGVLSLNRSNKLNKPWQQGAYGQGGSATFRFSDFTVIIGRRDPRLSSTGSDLVGWTIVWEDEGDLYRDALPVYRYLVRPDGDVPTFDPALLPDPEWHGLRIVHVAYELPRYSQAYTQLTTGIWGMFHAALFDPVLPFLVGGRRDADIKATKDINSTRVVVGNAARLNNPQGPAGDLEVTYANTEAFELGKALGGDLGRFRLNYWVVQRPAMSDAKTDPTSSYVTAEHAVSMTLFGQRQDAERRAWLKNQVQLPYLNRNLIVQIDVDELSPPAKRKLFASTRERGVEGELRDTIYRETAGLLRSDSELKRLEHEERERAMAKGAEQVAEKVREKLRKFVKTYLQGKTRPTAKGPEGNGGAPPRPSRPPAPPRDTNDTHLPAAPTAMAFERDPITIVRGRRTTVWVRLDAKNGYLRRHEDDLTVTFTPELAGKLADISKSELLAGKSLWTLQAAEGAHIGDGEIEAMMITPNGLIRAAAVVKVVEPPKPRERNQDEEPETGPEIRWVKREEWDDFGFTERTVGEAKLGLEATDILVNRHHRLLDRALKTRGLSPADVKSREDRYLFSIACGLYRQADQARELTDEPDAEYVVGELERMAEAVLVAIDDRMIELDDE